MKTSKLAACTFAAVLLSGCVTDAPPRTSLRPGGHYDPDARVRAAEMESDRPVILVPYGMYGYPGAYYGGGFGYYGAYGYGAPWYGYGMPGPVILPPAPRHYHRSQPTQPNGQTKAPNNPPRTFRDLFPDAKR